jgi:hypothetical protein
MIIFVMNQTHRHTHLRYRHPDAYGFDIPPKPIICLGYLYGM